MDIVEYKTNYSEDEDEFAENAIFIYSKMHVKIQLKNMSPSKQTISIITSFLLKNKKNYCVFT